MTWREAMVAALRLWRGEMQLVLVLWAALLITNLGIAAGFWAGWIGVAISAVGMAHQARRIRNARHSPWDGPR